MVICPDCGKEVQKAKFCKNCGAYIENIGQEVKADDGPVIQAGSDEEVKAADVTEIPIDSDEVDVNEEDIPVIPVGSGKGDVDNTPVLVDSVQKGEVIETPLERKENIKYCFNCGYGLGGDFRFCPNCGVDLKNVGNSNNRAVTVKKEKNIIIAIILSVFLPGLGQMYLGLDRKGALFLVAYIISAILILLIIGFLLCFIIWIWALIDTILSTNALNRGEEVEDKLF